MARLKAKYLVTRLNADGTMRAYWSPQRRCPGWTTVPLRLRTGQWLSRAKAAQAADYMNARVAACRAGDMPPPAPDLDVDWKDPVQPDTKEPAAPSTGKSPSLAPRGTLAHLIAVYMASTDYMDLRKKTRDGYARHLETIRKWGGDLALNHVTRKRIMASLYRPLWERKPTTANGLMRTFRLLLGWAAEYYPGVSVNPLLGVRLKAPPRLMDEDGRLVVAELWWAERVDLMVATADAMGLHSVGTFYRLMEHTGARPEDMASLARSAWDQDAGTLSFRIRKTSRFMEGMAVPPALAQRLTAELVRQYALHRQAMEHDLPWTFLVRETTGRPWTLGALSRITQVIRREAARTDPGCGALLNKHLRHSKVARMAMGGHSAEAIAAYTDHAIDETRAIIDTYMTHGRARIAQATSARLAAEEKGTLHEQ